LYIIGTLWYPKYILLGTKDYYLWWGLVNDDSLNTLPSAICNLIF